MQIETNIPLLEEILEAWKPVIGADYQAYKNHVYRVANFCLSIGPYGGEDAEKIIIAACFHDIGIWSDTTLDYLAPSEIRASDYLSKIGKEAWITEVNLMIEMHHKIQAYDEPGSPLVEAFRRADIADFSLGIFRMGFSADFIAAVRSEFPNAGFHKRLLQLGSKWLLRHPLNPLPMFRA